MLKLLYPHFCEPMWPARHLPRDVQMSGERHAWVDLAKGIGIILVVYGHIARGVYHASLNIGMQLFTVEDSVIYSFHMPLFFFLSGLFIHSSFTKYGAGGLAFRKLCTIFYPYVVWSLLQGFLEVALSDYTNGKARAEDVLVLLWVPRAQFWFLYSLFLMFIAVAGCRSLLGPKGDYLFLGASIMCYAYQDEFPSYVSRLFVMQYLVYFSAGLILGERATMPRMEKGTVLLILGFFLFASTQYLFHFEFGLLCNHNQTRWCILVAAVSIWFVSVLSQSIPDLKFRWLSYIGEHALYIFLMHTIAGSGTRIFLHKVFGVESVPLHLITGTVVGLFLPLLVVHWSHRISLTWLFYPPGQPGGQESGQL